jgi:hypothetical protein
MSQNTDNYILKLPDKLPNGGANVNASDLHIAATHASVEVLGIDGIAPNGPASPHGVGIKGNGGINITGINVKPGDTVTLRLKHTRDDGRLAFTYKWTYPRGAKGNDEPQEIAMVDVETPDDGTAVVSGPELQALILALLEALGPLEGRGRKVKER